ncbi:MAG: hypothetical protein U5N58_00975 [Actinomycetota bacterium]|nr:hypothetical protein [Actinomycetota bacterium]
MKVRILAFMLSIVVGIMFIIPLSTGYASEQSEAMGGDRTG